MESARLVLANPDPFEKELLRRLFLSRDYRVTVAADEDSAFRMVKRARPEVVVISDRRKDSQCARLTERIREVQELSGIGVITLIRNEDIELAVQCYEAGADTVLFTPTDLDLLVLTVQAVVRRTSTADLTMKIPRPLEVVPLPLTASNSA